MEGFFEYLHNIDGVFNVSRDVDEPVALARAAR